MDSAILEACQYKNCKKSKKNMAADNISNNLCNIGAHNIDNDSIIEPLTEMQNKGPINKLFRPIEVSNTSSKLPQSTPSPSAEENLAITINDSINKSIPLFLNRSLPVTPIVEPNTTPCFFYW